jgi:ribonucleoside-diphosphate reductase alpha chain
MQLATDNTNRPAVSAHDFSSALSPKESQYSQYKIIRRNGSVAGFEPNKISIAMTKAFIAVNGGPGVASARVREVVARLTDDVVNALMRRQPAGGTFHIEDIQDQVELALMRSGEHDVARSYVLYREDRARKRAKQKEMAGLEAPASILNVLENGRRIPLDTTRLLALIESSCVGLGEAVNPAVILEATLKDLYDEVPVEEVRKSLILSARALIEKEPAYSYVTARLLLHTIRFEALGEETFQEEMAHRYADYFPDFIKRGIDAELLDERLAFSARAGPAHRAAPGILHACCDGACA